MMADQPHLQCNEAHKLEKLRLISVGARMYQHCTATHAVNSNARVLDAMVDRCYLAGVTDGWSGADDDKH